METDKRGDLLWAGDNSIIILKDTAEGPDRTAVALFCVDYSPAGPGNAAFVITELPTGRVFACYTDHASLGIWLRDQIACTLPELATHELRDIPMCGARFAQSACAQTRTLLIASEDGEIRLTWDGLEQPYTLRAPGGTIGKIPYDLETTFYPARRAEVVISGRQCPGRVIPGADFGSSAFLALNETWYRPAR
jgi:hypothetical protein